MFMFTSTVATACMGQCADDCDLIIEIFLPSYINYKSDDLERRPDPVLDIVLTDEEVGKMFPE